MELAEFWKEISLMPEAVRQLEEQKITEEEYQKLREIFYRDLDLFYEEVKQRKDFRQVFLYCYSKMACEVYDRYCERGISRQIYRDTFYDLTLWCENCYKAYGEYGIAQYDWFSRHLNLCLFRLGRLQFERMQSLWDIQTRHGAIHRGDPVIVYTFPRENDWMLRHVGIRLNRQSGSGESRMDIFVIPGFYIPGFRRL